MQRVNFYFSEYHPKPVSFDSRFAGIILVSVLVCLLIYTAIESHYLEQSKKNLAFKKQQISQLESSILLAQKDIAKKINKKQLPEKIAAAQQKLNSYKKLALTLDKTVEVDHIKYSQILSALAENKLRSVWLTEISISDQGLNLAGATTNKNAIPSYVQQLNQSASLKRAFDTLDISRHTANDSVIHFKLVNGRTIYD